MSSSSQEEPSGCCCVLPAGCSDSVVGCHVSSRAAARLQKLLRVPQDPCWDTSLGRCLWSRFQMFPWMGWKHVGRGGGRASERERGRASERSQGPIRLGTLVNVLHRFCWQQDVPGCESRSSRGLRLSHSIQTHVRVHVHVHVHAPSRFLVFFCS